ncbi:Mcm2-like OB fold-containing protein [Methanopyrus sp.]
MVVNLREPEGWKGIRSLDGALVSIEEVVREVRGAERVEDTIDARARNSVMVHSGSRWKSSGSGRSRSPEGKSAPSGVTFPVPGLTRGKAVPFGLTVQGTPGRSTGAMTAPRSVSEHSTGTSPPTGPSGTSDRDRPDTVPAGGFHPGSLPGNVVGIVTFERGTWTVGSPVSRIWTPTDIPGVTHAS